MESVATVGTGRRGLNVEASAHGKVFGPTVVAGGLRGRYGLRDDLEISGDLTTVHVTEESATGTNPNVFLARIGVKFNPGHGFLAITGGLGDGWAPAGGPFTSADLGLIVAYENCYAVPFGSIRGFASVPLDPRPIDLSQPGNSDPVVDTPELTVGYSLQLGFRVPLSHERCPALAPVALTAGIGVTEMRDGDSSLGFGGAGVGLEANF